MFLIVMAASQESLNNYSTRKCLPLCIWCARGSTPPVAIRYSLHLSLDVLLLPVTLETVFGCYLV